MAMHDEHLIRSRPDSTDLPRVETFEDIRALPSGSDGVFVYRLTDAKLAEIAAQASDLRFLMADGNIQVTDHGLDSLSHFGRLECLDLEYSRVTDAGIAKLAAVRSLRWVDLGFCEAVSAGGLAELRRLRPDLEIVDAAG